VVINPLWLIKYEQCTTATRFKKATAYIAIGWLSFRSYLDFVKLARHP
jgi:hypothetical protein